MNKYLSFFKNEFRVELTWHLSWIFGMIIYIFLFLSVYPGSEGMADFRDLMNTPAFKAFTGPLSPNASLFLIWAALIAAFYPLLFAIYGLLTGVRIVLKSINDGQGEIVYSIDFPKLNYLLVRFGLAIFVSILLILTWIIPLAFPIIESIPLHILLKVSWMSLLFLICTISVGMVIGLLISALDKAQLITLIIVILFYSVQIIGNFNTDINKLNSYNLLNWFVPTSIMFGFKLESSSLIKLILLTLISLLIAFVGFIRKDLIKNSGIILPGNLGKNRMKSKKLYQNRVVALILLPFIYIKNFFTSPKNNPFVIPARILEKKFPITADFIYSERRVIIVMFCIMAIIWPGQLFAYPGDKEISDAILGFQGNPIFDLLTYGQLLRNQPFFWFIVSQAIAAHWFYILPLTFHWIKKITRADGENRFGEIIGSLPIKRSRVVFERIFGCFLILIALVVQMIIWLLLVENYMGRSVNQTWETIAIIMVIPLYMFMLNLGIFLTLIIKKHGFRYSSLALVAIVISWVTAIIGNNLNKWYILGFFGLYDPVKIIQKASLDVNNYGSIMLIIFGLFLLYPIYKVTKNYNWLEYDLEKGILPETYPTNS